MEQNKTLNNFCVALVTSTRQHWGMIDIDKVSIMDTLSKSEVIRTCKKFVHIKCVPGDELILKDKIAWFKFLGFDVTYTIEGWKNDDSSHHTGIVKDMAKIYNYSNILNNTYVLHLENDWIFEINELDNLILKSVQILERDPQIIYHRYTRVDQKDIVERLAANYRYHIDCYTTNREFSFNPFVSRTRDMKYISNFVANAAVHPHCEMAYEIVAKFLNKQENIFAFTNNNVVRHLGGQENKEEYESKVKFVK